MPTQIATIEDLQAVIEPLQRQIAELTARLETPAWLSVKEYAELHRISERTVHRLVERGDVDSKRAGKRLLIRAA